jgi:hypothetical protein
MMSDNNYNSYDDKDLQLSADGDEEQYINDYKNRARNINVSSPTSISRGGKVEEVVYNLKELDLASIPPLYGNRDEHGVKMVIIGKAGSGKSTVIADLIASKAHIIPVSQVFSGTEDSNGFYGTKMPGITVFNKLDLNAIAKMKNRQKIAKQYLENPWCLQIVDDCTDDPKVLRHPIFQDIFKNGRHWSLLFILSLQYSLDVLPGIRTNIDYAFIFRESSMSNRKKLYENYASCIDSFSDFCALMDQLTNDYTCLVINNRSKTNNPEDCLFWYRAKPDKLPPNWKFGASSFWQFHNDRFNRDVQE